MAFVNKHISSSCNFFIIVTVLVSLVMAYHVSSAPITDCSSNVPTDPSTQEHIKQVLGGMEILIELGSRLNGTILDIQDFQSVRLERCLIVCLICSIMPKMVGWIKSTHFE